jgi:K+-transporting ATPase ATPase C chain
MVRAFRSTLTLFVILMAITGLAYPMLVRDLGQALFPFQANGSLLEHNGTIIGSNLIGQNFISAIYFHPRPSAAGDGYDGLHSSGSNLTPSSADFIKAVGERIVAWRTVNNAIPVPVDLVTASGSGLDPHISVAGAKFQASNVARARHMDVTKVEQMISRYTAAPLFGLLGEPRVNVLELNRALDQTAPSVRP